MELMNLSRIDDPSTRSHHGLPLLILLASLSLH